MLRAQLDNETAKAYDFRSLESATLQDKIDSGALSQSEADLYK